MKRNFRYTIVLLFLIVIGANIYFLNLTYRRDSSYDNISKDPLISKDLSAQIQRGSSLSGEYEDIWPKLIEKPQTKKPKEDPSKITGPKSQEFIKAAFDRSKRRVNRMLAKGTAYVQNPDGSAFIRCDDCGDLVEGYMATDKKLDYCKERWAFWDDDGTLTAGVEVYVKGDEKPHIWYMHFRNEKGQWRIFMLENDV